MDGKKAVVTEIRKAGQVEALLHDRGRKLAFQRQQADDDCDEHSRCHNGGGRYQRTP